MLFSLVARITKMASKKSSCLDGFGLNHQQPWLFYGPKCRLPMSLFTIYRILIAIYFVIIYIFDVVYKAGRPTPQMAYGTMWSYLLQTIALCLKMAITLHRAVTTRCKRPDETIRGTYPLKMSWILQVEWILHNITITVPVVISIQYWVGYNEALQFRFDNEPQTMQFAIQMHGVNGAVAILELLLSAIPIQLGHFYQPLVYNVFYLMFKYLYYAATGVPNIYTNQPVTDVKQTFTDFGIYELITLACFVIIWIISTLQTRCCKTKGPAIDSRDFGIYDVRTPLLNAAIP